MATCAFILQVWVMAETLYWVRSSIWRLERRGWSDARSLFIGFPLAPHPRGSSRQQKKAASFLMDAAVGWGWAFQKLIARP